VALLSLLGGWDIPRFSAYLVPLLAIALATLLADEPGRTGRPGRILEIAIALGATFAFNRTYCGHGRCGDSRLLARSAELAVFIGGGAALASLARRRLA
jgi:hypothetical protein